MTQRPPELGRVGCALAAFAVLLLSLVFGFMAVIWSARAPDVQLDGDEVLRLQREGQQERNPPAKPSPEPSQP